MADYVSKDMINKAMQVDLLEYAKSLGMEFETRGRNNTFYQKGHSLNITRSKICITAFQPEKAVM